MAHSSTLTFLFTDIEGSTRLWDAHPDLMRKALGLHDNIIRRAIESNGGIVFKTIGDAFCAAFAKPDGAVIGARQAQIELAGQTWDGMDPIRVRMSIHTGEAECRDADYFGPPLNRVSRMLQLGHGGQTLVSKVTVDAIHATGNGDLAFRDLGEHRLKDLQQPEQVFQLLHPLLQESFRPLKSLDTLPNNLPQQMTTFIGRERELREIKRLLHGASLLTLIGAGGTGKTRLGVQVAYELLDPSNDGSWLVEYGAVSDPALVPQTLSSILGVLESPVVPLTDTLIEFLRTKRMLLIFDNCEHLIDPVAKLVGKIVRHCPHVQILATARERLMVDGERTFHVPSLSMPDPAKRYSREALVQFEAVRLFVDRAMISQPHFEVTDDNVVAVAHLCHRLDGIPLAIELAAARVRAMPVDKIAERLDDRFRLLTGGSRTALPRHQTLRAMIDWSYDLLGDVEKLLFRRLSVFAGGWNIEGAEHVCSDDQIEGWEVVDLLHSLVDKSLVVYDTVSQRFRLSETVRAYGREALTASGELEVLRSRHLVWFKELALSCESLFESPKAIQARTTLDAEIENIRSAIEWGSEAGDPIFALQLANALHRYFELRGFFNEGASIYTLLLGKVPPSAKADRASAWNSLGVLYFRQTRYEAAEHALAESLPLYKEIGNESGAARAVNAMGVMALQQERYEEARELLEQALALFKAVDNHRMTAMTLNNLGVLAIHEDDLARARQLYEDALEFNRSVGNRIFEAGNLSNLADLILREGDPKTARQLARSAIEIHIELGDRFYIQDSLETLAPAEMMLGRPKVAALLFAAKEALMEQLETQVPGYVLAEYQRNVAQVRAALGDDAFEELTAKGRHMSPEEAYRASLEE